MGKSNEWALGICKESVDRKKKSDFSSERGFWVISMKAGATYTCSVPEIRIPASPRLSWVGVFLDIELEEIKFFDISHDAFIYINSNISCLEPLCPLFCPELPREGGNAAVLTICPSEVHPFLDSSSEMNEIFHVKDVRMTKEEAIW